MNKPINAAEAYEANLIKVREQIAALTKAIDAHRPSVPNYAHAGDLNNVSLLLADVLEFMGGK